MPYTLHTQQDREVPLRTENIGLSSSLHTWTPSQKHQVLFTCTCRMVRHLEGLVLSPGRQTLAGCSEGGTSPCGSSGAWSQRTDLHLPSIFHGNNEALNPHTFYTMLIKVKSPWYHNVTIGAAVKNHTKLLCSK